MEGLCLKRTASKMGISLREQEPLAPYTTFRIGGPARFFARPNDFTELCALRQAASEDAIPCVVIGNGSNLLVNDDGYPGLVLRTPEGPVVCEGNQLRASAGTALSRVALAAWENGLAGMSFAHGIPGTVGGAVTMNAGAYGGEISKVLFESIAIDEKGNSFTVSLTEHHFAYRTSVYQTEPHWLCREATFLLTPGDKTQIRTEMEEFAARRREKQPLDRPSAGSVYKRPKGFFAGKLIEDCGLKGVSVGDAQVSEKHAGFIINNGNASCSDVLKLMSYIEETVWMRFGVHLEREVRVLQ